MFNFPCIYSNYNSMMRSDRQPNSFVRILHSSPMAPPLDVYLNGSLVAQNITYGHFTPYLKLPSGDAHIRVYRSGNVTNPILTKSTVLAQSGIYTLSIIGKFPNTDILPINDVRIPPNPNFANLRFIHLSPDTPAVDIVLPNNTMIHSNLTYKGVTDYTPLSPGRYTIEVKLSGSNNIILTVPNIYLNAMKNLSMYIIGLFSGNPSLEALIPLDGSSYLGF